MPNGNVLPSAVALGMFDGMHLGHQAVIKKAVELAREQGLQSVVYTFENHPRSVFATAPLPLMNPHQRRRAMEQLGVDRVDMVLFDRQLAALSPRQFLDMLGEKYRLAAIVAGEDYTFGAKGAGTVETLKQLAPEYGFQVHVLPFVMMEGEKVSSTRIRQALQTGREDLARQMMGR